MQKYYYVFAIFLSERFGIVWLGKGSLDKGDCVNVTACHSFLV